MAILSSFYSLINSLLPRKNDGQVLRTKAVPGLMTVLDVALQQSVEVELTGTLTTSHAVLAALFDVKMQAKRVIKMIREEGTPVQSPMQSNKVVVDSFSRACLDAACDIIEVLTTDKLAETANLSDPYEKLSSSNNYNNATHQTSITIQNIKENATPELPTAPLPPALESATSSGSVSLSHLSADSSNIGDESRKSESTDDWWKAFYESTHDTGRRIPLPQRSRDLWETSRLHCVDYMWGDELLQSSQRILRHLVKHPLVSEVNHHHTVSPTLAFFSEDGLEEIMMLIQLVQVDLPARLLQFRAAYDAESVVLKRLYLIKCEMRAPFRAYLEAHQSILRAPSVETVQDYEEAARSKQHREERKQKAKKKLQSLLETPELVTALTLEQTCQHLEIEISKALYPFCELARYLDHKRAALRHSEATTVVELQILLHRLKGLLSRKSSGHDSSVGIRPLLLDMQNIPREDELKRNARRQLEPMTTDEWEVQVDKLIRQLGLLNECCRTRGSFYSDKKADVDAPGVVMERCAKLDVELFRCHCLDWFTLVDQQHANGQDWGAVAEDIHQAELEVSLASVATSEALQAIGQRLQLLEQDREKRFGILEEILEDFARRELSLILQLQRPEPRQVLALRPTSAKGVFGIPLELAGETLPIG